MISKEPKPFRRLSGEHVPPFAIRDANRSPLILINKYGEAEHASVGFEKDALIARFEPANGDQLLWAWVGEWQTDVFSLTKADLAAHYAAPPPAPKTAAEIAWAEERKRAGIEKARQTRADKRALRRP